MKRKFPLTLLLMAIALSIASLLFSEFVYQVLVVPRLPGWQSIPVWWWPLLIGPFYLVCLFVGTKLRTWTDFFIFSISAALASQLFDFIAANLNLPGRLKSFATEAPLFFWTVGTLIGWVTVAVVIGMGIFIGKKLNDPRQSRGFTL